MLNALMIRLADCGFRVVGDSMLVSPLYAIKLNSDEVCDTPHVLCLRNGTVVFGFREINTVVDFVSRNSKLLSK